MKQIVRKEEGLMLTCLLPEGRMERRAADSRPGLLYFHGVAHAQDGVRLPEARRARPTEGCLPLAS